MDILTNFFNQIQINNSAGIFGFLGLVTITVFVLAFLNKAEQARQLRLQINKLKRSFDDLDEQAKLIVKTDLELNKTQEELDKRLAALNALQKTSRLISTTLDADEIFQRLARSLVTELGFEKTTVCMLDEKKELYPRLALGLSKEEALEALHHLTKENSIYTSLREGRTFSSATSPKQKKEKIAQFFKVDHFICIPILSQDGMIGILFVGNGSERPPITEGDEELISILAHQIGQSLENAQLFEQVYRSRQELESKIQDRTSELARALEEVKTISKAKSEFVSAVSHELRTPLTSIKGYASILITGKMGEIPEEVKQRLAKIDKHSDNLVSLINDLLDISRIESGRVEMKVQEQNIAELLDYIRDLLLPQMKEKNITFSTQIEPNLPSVFIDRSQFERVLINLLSNAIKFTPANGQITIRIQRENYNVYFTVCDTGIGIKQEDLSQLFNEFYRVENEINQNVKGTGLGLALVKKIIEAHQGKIWVTSQVGQGTVFHFQIPVVQSKGESYSTSHNQ
ncbi:MAG: ATP-binding protein [Candidatus Omnitrophota bacterium]